MEEREIRKVMRKKVAKRCGGVVHLKLRYQLRAAAKCPLGLCLKATFFEHLKRIEDYYVEPSELADRDLL
jgi:hypothetical protein